jgi:gliding motility-associated-like protein
MRVFFALCGLLAFVATIQAQVLEFVENKGQWNKNVLFRANLNTGALFLEKQGYTVLQYDAIEYINATRRMSGHPIVKGPSEPMAFGAGQLPQGDSFSSHAYRVRFSGASAAPQVQPQRPMPGYSNFFIGNNPATWASRVLSYEAVQMNELYPGIDIKYYSDEGFVKYDLIVAAGAPVEALEMTYEGVNKLSVENGDLVIHTSVGNFREKEPYAYQLVEGRRVKIPARYWVEKNKVRFRLQGYNAKYPLVIDPTFIFSTFAGSPPDNWGYSATFDAEGNAYGGGIVFGNGYPTTPGAAQVIFGGGINTGEGSGFDISIIKLDPRGTTRIYSTYLGGSSNEQPHSLVVDNQGNLIVAGRTLSTNYPVWGTLQRVGPRGQWDIVVTKFNPAGTGFVGSIIIGGTRDDGVNDRHKFPNPAPAFTNQNYGDDARSEVITDAAGFIYLAACTQSADFPVTPNNVQSSLRGVQDAIVLRLNPSLSNLEFATYLGGTNYDAAYVLTIEADGNLLVAGGTMSSDFPGFKSGTVGPVFAGGLLDGFIARLAPTGSALLEVAYIGTTGNDQIYGIQHDRNGFVYVMGTSTGDFPVRNATFRQTGGKQFIAKLQKNLSAYVYSTVFGTNSRFPNLSPTAFLVDICENVYVSGWGGNIIQGTNYPIVPTTGMTVTPDAIKANTDGLDFYFFVLEKDATRQLYGSFFGQQDPQNTGSHDHVDGGTSRFDANGVIYQGICANCNGGQFPTTPGTLSPTNPSRRCNLAVVKIDFNLSGVRTGVQSFIDGLRRDSSSCVPALIEFRDSIAVGRRFEWDFGDGSPVVITDSPRVNYTYRREGNYRVRLIAIDDTKCISRDTSFINIRVRIDRVRLNAVASPQPPCSDFIYRFDNTSIPFPGKPFADSSFTWFFGDNSTPVRAGLNSVTHRFPGPGTYNVRLVLSDTNYCNAPDSFFIQVRIAPNVTARFEAPIRGCAPLTVNFRNLSVGGTSFEWDFGNGQRSNLTNPSVTFTTAGSFRVGLRSFDPNTCNLVDSSFAVIIVDPLPVAGFDFAPNPSQENIPTTFTNTSRGGNLFRWYFGDGDSLITRRLDTLVRHQFPRSDVFNTCLLTQNEFGCSDTLCRDVVARVNPLVDVVSAFTPNGDGINDRAIVIGFGVRTMVFRIFNRWGELMFETADYRQGWDGTYKGKPQPMDAYAWTLEADLINGEKVKRAGSVMLIR